jgi:N-acetylneuraminate synthase
MVGNDHYHAMDPDDIRAFRRQQTFIEALMGDGELGEVSTQEAARKFARRSLVAARDIPAGTVVTADMIAVKRPGTGIPPQDIEKLLGTAAITRIPDDTILHWDMFGRRSCRTECCGGTVGQ